MLPACYNGCALANDAVNASEPCLGHTSYDERRGIGKGPISLGLEHLHNLSSHPRLGSKAQWHCTKHWWHGIAKLLRCFHIYSSKVWAISLEARRPCSPRLAKMHSSRKACAPVQRCVSAAVTSRPKLVSGACIVCLLLYVYVTQTTNANWRSSIISAACMRVELLGGVPMPSLDWK